MQTVCRIRALLGVRGNVTNGPLFHFSACTGDDVTNAGDETPFSLICQSSERSGSFSGVPSINRNHLTHQTADSLFHKASSSVVR
ncbi:hypothetical protein [Uliginosibacterium sp. H1]|uniref:hypothetical protein n=1 Tax=Uliginosibacterium sp. H1 TaxID=3114757 RepID=UPI002E173D33|nr:hypothetical protein [Uliginosibacterium sp. H1]